MSDSARDHEVSSPTRKNSAGFLIGFVLLMLAGYILSPVPLLYLARREWMPKQLELPMMVLLSPLEWLYNTFPLVHGFYDLLFKLFGVNP